MHLKKSPSPSPHPRHNFLRDGPVENLLRGGRSTKKKYSRKGKLNEKKILARQLILKNIHAIHRMQIWRISKTARV